MAFQGFCSLTEEWINTAIDSCVDPGLFLPFSTFHCHPKRRCNSFWAVLPQTIWCIHMDALPGLSGARGPLTGNLSRSGFAGGETRTPQTGFKVRPLHRGRGQAKLSSYPKSLVFQISLISRKLSGTAPAGRADPNCDFFQAREAPPGQTGSDHSA